MKLKKRIRIHFFIICSLLSLLLLIGGCGSVKGGYTQITQDEAQRIMEEEQDYIILDVRTDAEYASSHIPGAICLPNESIIPGDASSEKLVNDTLPEKAQKILVYCRTGRRSKEASEKLASFGYSNILEFGGIESWKGNIITSEYSAAMRLSINGESIPVVWESNASVEAIKQLAAGSGLTIQMSKYGGFEQVGSLGTDIVRDDVQMTTAPGDIVLYSGNQIVVFYGTNSWAYTKLGKINLSEAELEELLGGDNVQLTLAY